MAGGRNNTNRNNKSKKKQQKKGDLKKLNQQNGNRSNSSSCASPIQQPPLQQQPTYWPDYMNFVHEAGIGCHIGFPQHYYQQQKEHRELVHSNTEYYDWILDWEDIDIDDEYDDDDDEMLELPELQIDPEDYTLSLYNYNQNDYQIAFISIYDCKVYGKNSRSYDEPLVSSSSVTITTEAGTATSMESTNNNSSNEEYSKTSSSTQQQQQRSCTTLIVLCPPCTICHLCYIEHKSDDISYYENIIDSDIQIWKSHPNIHDFHKRTILFPLLTTTSSTFVSNNDCISSSSISSSSSTTTTTAVASSYLCTQGVGGSLTHFLIGNYHAIDFACPIGTPIIAVGNGTIIQVHMMMMSHNNNNNNNNNHVENGGGGGGNTTTVTGIAVSNLFHWNSIMLRLDDDNEDKDHDDHTTTMDTTTLTTTDENDTSATTDALYVEYVHIATSIVQVNEQVRAGQIIGTTGSVGFSPEPHLHIAAYRTSDNFAPTCGVYFHCGTSSCRQNDKSERNTFLPVAGQWYNETGIVQPNV